MDTTRVSLIVRVKNRHDARAWEEFVSLYRPILIRYARARGLSPEDSDDAAQDCLGSISRNIQRFEYDPCRGRFRGWLKKIVNDRVSGLLRRRAVPNARDSRLSQVRSDEPSPADVWEQICLEEHLRYCLTQVRAEVAAKTYEMFVQVALAERPVVDVCRDLMVSPNQVYVARCRVMRRLQEMMSDLMGSDD